MKERLLEFLRKENKSSAQLAEEIGVQPSGISHILSGRNNPSLDFVLKMLDKYQFISTEWLLFGKGNMYKESKSALLFDEFNLDGRNQVTDSGIFAAKTGQDGVDTKTVKSVNEAVNLNIEGAVQVRKIVLFYKDSTFEEYSPR